MAANSSASENESSKQEAKFSTFMDEVKAIEKRDSVLTPKQQIDRLLRPGSTYFNLNPFEVIQVPPEMLPDDIRKKFRRLSILIHPDKNMDDRDRAQKAFEILTNAMKTIEDEDKRKSTLAIIEEAKEKNEFLLEEKRKKLKKESKSTEVEEDDDPEKFQETLYKTTVKLFADYEIRRRELAERDAALRKREREEEIVAEEKAKKQKEWEKEWEKNRDDRVESWRDFKQGGKKKKTKSKNRMVFKPPKPKLEQK